MNKLITPLHAARLCKASYHNFDVLDGPVEALEDMGYKLLFSLQSDLGLETEGWALVNKTRSYVVLVFPGSMSLRDWILNFKTKFKMWPTNVVAYRDEKGNVVIDAVKYESGRVAEGAWIEWYKCWYKVWKALRLELMKSTDARTMPLIITGHSRGAQLAKTVGLSLKKHQYDYYDLYLAPCFASPKTGDLAWCQYYNSLMGEVTWDYVNGADIVPHLPTVGMGYFQASGIYYAKDNVKRLTWMNQRPTNAGMEWPRTWDEIDELSIRDHSIDAYIEALERLEK